MLYTQGAVIVAMVYLFVPLMILTLVGVLENIPRGSASGLGLARRHAVGTFWQVILPLAVPGLIVGAVLVFTGASPPTRRRSFSGGERQMMMARSSISAPWSPSTGSAHRRSRPSWSSITIASCSVMSRLARRLNPWRPDVKRARSSPHRHRRAGLTCS